ncbi:competence/damage-inducible protein A [Brevibacillus brevis]|uniref:competence/damage-inducible protein A n=1 Tax=Brevibacillus brevis TaxID=1393 RepID=UPI0025704667|nr:competence/damage-inducible protein A [Lysinibacillus sp. SDF0063]
MQEATATIISIGSELIDGMIADTNSKWIAKNLQSIGINVASIMIVPDTKEQIVSAVKTALSQSKILVMNGGLGATHDDLTRKALGEIFSIQWQYYISGAEKIKRAYSGYGNRDIPMEAYNQLMYPSEGKVLENDLGTAVSFSFTHDGKDIYVLPGVPAEMKAIVNNVVVPEIINKHDFGKYDVWMDWMLYGVTEEEVAKVIESLHDSRLKIGVFVEQGMIRVKISGPADYTDNMPEYVRHYYHQVQMSLSSWKYGEKGVKVEEIFILMFSTIPFFIVDNALGGTCVSLLKRQDCSFIVSGIVGINLSVISTESLSWLDSSYVIIELNWGNKDENSEQTYLNLVVTFSGSRFEEEITVAHSQTNIYERLSRMVLFKVLKWKPSLEMKETSINEHCG